MRTAKRFRLVTSIVALLVALGAAAPRPAAAGIEPTPFDEFFDAFFDVFLTVQIGQFPPDPIHLLGPARLVQHPPDPVLPDTIPIEILSMRLIGIQGELLTGIGQGEIQLVRGFAVDSFFDVFTQLTLPDGTLLHNDGRLHVSSGPIDSYPPDPIHPWFCVACGSTLFDRSGQPVGQILAASIAVVPEPSSLGLLACGALALGAAALARRRRPQS